jgi:hypothetical protein
MESSEKRNENVLRRKKGHGLFFSLRSTRGLKRKKMENMLLCREMKLPDLNLLELSGTMMNLLSLTIF